MALKPPANFKFFTFISSIAIITIQEKFRTLVISVLKHIQDNKFHFLTEAFLIYRLRMGINYVHCSKKSSSSGSSHNWMLAFSKNEPNKDSVNFKFRYFIDYKDKMGENKTQIMLEYRVFRLIWLRELSELELFLEQCTMLLSLSIKLWRCKNTPSPFPKNGLSYISNHQFNHDENSKDSTVENR